ncbi:30S ribosomal protein S6 [bacterium]|nr:30S ribosomal protein S6 [bacterium]
MKRHYEVTAILSPEGGNDVYRQFIDRVNGITEKFEGRILNLQSWGEKKLAYEIKRNVKGHYLFFDIHGEGTLIAELERNFNIWEHVLKFMTIVVDPRTENLEEILENAPGLEGFFSKSEKKHAPVERKVAVPVEKKKEAPTDNREYNAQLQKTLSKAEAEKETDDVEL